MQSATLLSSTMTGHSNPSFLRQCPRVKATSTMIKPIFAVCGWVPALFFYKSHYGLIYDSGHQAFHARGVSRSMNPLPFLGIVWFTKKSCEVDVSVKRYSLQMRLFSLEHFIFLSKVTCLIIGRAMPNWRDTIQPITDISLKLPTWCCGERILGMKKSEKRVC